MLFTLLRASLLESFWVKNCGLKDRKRVEMAAELYELDLSDTEIEEFFRENDALWVEETKNAGEEVKQCYCGVPSTSVEVIRCDNAKCPKQWFHLECVGLTEKLEGEWFCCPKCLEGRFSFHCNIPLV